MERVWNTLGLIPPENDEELLETFRFFAVILNVPDYQPAGPQLLFLFHALGLNVPQTNDEFDEFANLIRIVLQPAPPLLPPVPVIVPPIPIPIPIPIPSQDVEMKIAPVPLNMGADFIVISRDELERIGLPRNIEKREVLARLQNHNELMEKCVPRELRNATNGLTDVERLEMICKHGKRIMKLGNWDDNITTAFLDFFEETEQKVRSSTRLSESTRSGSASHVAELIQRMVQERMELIPVFSPTEGKAITRFINLIREQGDKKQGLFQNNQGFNDDFKLLLDVFNFLTPGSPAYTHLYDHAKKLKESMNEAKKSNIEEYLDFVKQNHPMAMESIGELADMMKDNRFSPKTAALLLRKLASIGIRSDQALIEWNEQHEALKTFSRFCFDVTIEFVKESENMVNLANRHFITELQTINAMLNKLGPAAMDFRTQFATRMTNELKRMGDSKQQDRDVVLNLGYLNRLLENPEFRSFETGMALLSQAIRPRSNDPKSAYVAWFTRVRQLCVTLLSPSAVISSNTINQAIRTVSTTFDRVTEQLETLIVKTGESKTDILNEAALVVEDRVSTMSRTLSTIILQYTNMRREQGRITTDKIAIDIGNISIEKLTVACKAFLDQKETRLIADLLFPIAVKEADPLENRAVMEVLEQGIATLITEKKDGSELTMITTLKQRLTAKDDEVRRAGMFITKVAGLLNSMMEASIADEKGTVLQINARDIMQTMGSVDTITNELSKLYSKVQTVQIFETKFAKPVGLTINQLLDRYTSELKLLNDYKSDINELVVEFKVGNEYQEPREKIAAIKRNAQLRLQEVKECMRIKERLEKLYLKMKLKDDEKVRAGQVTLELYEQQVSYIIGMIETIYNSRKEFEEELDRLYHDVSNRKYQNLIDKMRQASKPGASRQEKQQFTELMLRADYLGPDGDISKIPDPYDLDFTSWTNRNNPKEVSFSSLFEFMTRVAGHCGVNIDTLMFSPALHIKMSSSAWKFAGVRSDSEVPAPKPPPPPPVPPPAASAPAAPPSLSIVPTEKYHRKFSEIDRKYDVDAFQFLMQRYGGLLDDDSDSALDMESRENLRIIAIKAMKRLPEIIDNDSSKYKDALVHYLKPHPYAMIINSHNILVSSFSQFKGIILHEMMHSPGLTDHFAVMCASQIQIAMMRSPKAPSFSNRQYEELIMQSNTAAHFLSLFNRNRSYEWSRT